MRQYLSKFKEEVPKKFPEEDNSQDKTIDELVKFFPSSPDKNDLYKQAQKIVAFSKGEKQSTGAVYLEYMKNYIDQVRCIQKEYEL